MLNDAQLMDFEHAGVLRLPKFYREHHVAAMTDALWDDLAHRYGVDRARPGTWGIERPGHFQQLERSNAFSPLASAEIKSLLDRLLGDGKWLMPRHWGQPLVTFPTGSWDVPHAMWHLDYPPTDCLGEMPAVSVFVFLEAVRPKGGGTLYIHGSNRVVLDRARHCAVGERVSSAEMRAILQREEPWFAGLFRAGGADRIERYMSRATTVRNVDVQVCEMTGEPGDAIVMHPAMIHGVAANGLDRPRMMLVQRITRRSSNPSAD